LAVVISLEVSVCVDIVAELDVFGIVVEGVVVDGAVCVEVCASAGIAANRAAAATPPRIFACMLITEFLSNDLVLIHEIKSPRA
jgi:hypothetical protein